MLKWIEANPNYSALIFYALFIAAVSFFIHRSYKKTAKYYGDD